MKLILKKVAKSSTGEVVDKNEVGGSTGGTQRLGATSVEGGKHSFTIQTSGSNDVKVGLAIPDAHNSEPGKGSWCISLSSRECFFDGVTVERKSGPDVFAVDTEVTMKLDSDEGSIVFVVGGTEIETTNTVPNMTPLALAVSSSSELAKILWTDYSRINAIPAALQQNVLADSYVMPADSVTIEGYDFNNGVDYHQILQSYLRTGFQATNFGLAVQEINRMRRWRLSDEPIKDDEPKDLLDPEVRKATKCKIFFGYTSNLISAGTREQIRWMAEHKMVDVIVTTAGGIEEDFIKCLAPTYTGDFKLKGSELRKKGMNRIGNMLVPNNNYCAFEDWFMPLLDTMLEEQKAGFVWSPSKMIHRMGKEINDPRSVYYWCYKNNIPVYSPAITDGSIGDMVYFHSFNNPGFIIDLVQDIRCMNDEAFNAKGKTGMLILGGGVVKHHIHNANLMRNGADFAVIVNTAHEFDGSDSGANPDEAISWGKIKVDAKPVKISGEATMIFPLLLAETFARPAETETETESEDEEPPRRTKQMGPRVPEGCRLVTLTKQWVREPLGFDVSVREATSDDHTTGMVAEIKKVIPGGLAAGAGLRAGDRIVQIGDIKLNLIYYKDQCLELLREDIVRLVVTPINSADLLLKSPPTILTTTTTSSTSTSSTLSVSTCTPPTPSVSTLAVVAVLSLLSMSTSALPLSLWSLSLISASSLLLLSTTTSTSTPEVATDTFCVGIASISSIKT
eukprot:m.178992 g.178992  ORF g.178992 m.178992 type:complete len:734 (-) comp31954_c3_seq2:872-3073(-)